jgi:hypothetical protein
LRAGAGKTHGKSSAFKSGQVEKNDAEKVGVKTIEIQAIEVQAVKGEESEKIVFGRTSQPFAQEIICGEAKIRFKS